MARRGALKGAPSPVALALVRLLGGRQVPCKASKRRLLQVGAQPRARTCSAGRLLPTLNPFPPMYTHTQRAHTRMLTLRTNADTHVHTAIHADTLDSLRKPSRTPRLHPHATTHKRN